MNKSVVTITIIFFLSFVTQNLKAQCSFTLSDLEYSSKQTQLEFEVYILKKGYILGRALEWPFRRKEYICDTIKETLGTNSLNCSYGSGKNIVITYVTTNKQLYENTKDSVVLRGYSLSKEDQKDLGQGKTTWYYYIKGKTQITLYIEESPRRILYVEEIRILE